MLFDGQPGLCLFDICEKFKSQASVDGGCLVKFLIDKNLLLVVSSIRNVLLRVK